MKRGKKTITAIVMMLATIITAIILLANRKKRGDELAIIQGYRPVIPVEIIYPVMKQVSQTYTENGTLKSAAEVTILSETSGRALSVNGNIGDRVSQGTVLVTVEKEVSESQLQLAEMNLENAKKDLARYALLAGEEAVTPQQLEVARLRYQDAFTQHKVAKKQLENCTIRSTVNGVIAERMIEEGSFLIPSMPLFTLSVQDRLIFSVHVAEREVLLLHPGQETQVSIDAFPGEVFTGNLRGISRTPDMAGRYEVEVVLRNPEGKLLAGMSGSAAFTPEEGKKALVIPRKCIDGSIREGKIFVVRGDSVAACRIEAFTLNENEVIVREGITGTERIVVSGQINLENDSRVRVMNSKKPEE